MLHMQGGIPNWLSPVSALPPVSMVKSVMNGSMLVEAKQVNPNVVTVYRHYVPQNEQVVGGSWAENVGIARSFLQSFVDGTFFQQYAPHVDAVELYNEHINWTTPQDEVARRVQFEQACAEVWKNEFQASPTIWRDGNPIRLVHANTSVGNNIPRELAEIAIAYDNWLGYHAYSKWDHGQRDGGDWTYHSGRWNTMEQSWGLKPTWAFTESGPYYDAEKGWKHEACLGDSIDAYVDAMRLWIGEIQRTPAYAEGRLKGFALFTTGPDHVGWPYYQTRFPELDALSAMVAQEWDPGNEPTPEPGGTTLIVNRRFNLRNKPSFDNSLLYTMSVGTVLEYDGVVNGVEWSGSNQWYRANVYLHTLGADLHRAIIPASSSEFVFETWPTDYKVITQRFGARPWYYAQWGLPGHEGVDIRALPGTPIYAVANGTVYLATGDEGNYGIQVRIKHYNGYKSVYAHLQSAEVSVGDTVEAGDVIGYADATGNAQGAHLHFMLKKEGESELGYPRNIVDPTPFLMWFDPQFVGG